MEKITKNEKGDGNMVMRKVLHRRMNIGKHEEIGYDELDSETGEQIIEGNLLHELGVKFNSDKKKLEDEIEKVKSSKISDKDKASIIIQLYEVIDMLQKQYENDVEAEEVRVQEKIKTKLEMMDEAVDELEQQVDSLKSVTMDVASTDARAATDEAESKKQEFIRMRSEYAEKLRLQMEQAEMMQRQIRARNLNNK